MFVLCISAVLAVAAAPATSHADAGEQVVVFLQPDDSEVHRAFEQQTWPALQKIAADLGVEVTTVDVSKHGAPEMIRSTPSIVFMNHRGRSVYQGRLTTLDRIENFIRTSRVIPQGAGMVERTRTPVRAAGRLALATPIKISALAGTAPDGFDADAFVHDMQAAIAAGMDGYELAEKTTLARTDRLFYIDFHPYRSESGDLFVSSALFSQFHCHDPLFTRFESAWRGTWDDRSALFGKAAAELVERIDAAMADGVIGDGLQPLATDVPVVSWEALQLSLPERPTGLALDADLDLELPDAWIVESDVAGNEVHFRFPAPLDGYAGRATSLTGRLEAPGQELTQLDGWFQVDADSVTMGEPDLDSYIHGIAMLNVTSHPTSRFTIDRVTADASLPLAFGSLVPVQLSGTFSMKGVDIPLDVPAQLELTVGEDRRPRLRFDATWSLDLYEPFGMEGPDGDESIRNTLLFTANIVLVPVGR